MRKVKPPKPKVRTVKPNIPKVGALKKMEPVSTIPTKKKKKSEY